MIRVYCQYSVSGFKVFQLNCLPHVTENVRYVKMIEVNNAVHGEEQDFVITGTCGCNLDIRIMRLFSMNGVSLLYLHNVGKNSNENALYVNEPSIKMSYAFVSDDAKDKTLLFKLASLWLSKKNKLANRLQKISGMIVVDDEPVFAFHENVWQDLLEDASKSMVSPNFEGKLGNGRKNILSNLIINKASILSQVGIKEPVSTFVTIPGNEEVRKSEQTNRIIKYATIGAIALTAIGITIYCCSNK